MWFWWFLLICDILIPFIMIVAGRIMWKHPPKKINWFVGYRTASSMRNADTWKFAHEHSGRLWWKLGWLVLIPSILIHIPFYGKSDDALGIVSVILMVVQLIVLIGSVVPTSRALRREFTEDGKRRSTEN